MSSDEDPTLTDAALRVRREKEAESAKRKPKEPPAETPVHDEEDTDRDEPEVPASCIPGIGLDLEPEYAVSG